MKKFVKESINERDSWKAHDAVNELPEDVKDIILDYCQGMAHLEFDAKDLPDMVMKICSRAADVMGGITISNPWKGKVNEWTGPEDDGIASSFGPSELEKFEGRIPESNVIRDMARQMDEKEFDEWWWETVYKK